MVSLVSKNSVNFLIIYIMREIRKKTNQTNQMNSKRLVFQQKKKEKTVNVINKAI